MSGAGNWIPLDVLAMEGVTPYEVRDGLGRVDDPEEGDAMDLLALAADLEAIGGAPEISGTDDPTLQIDTDAMTVIVYGTGAMCFATNDGGSAVAIPGLDTAIWSVIARHAERMRPVALAAAA